MSVALLASQCPLPQVASLSVYRTTALDTTALVAPNIPGSDPSWRLQANQLGSIIDQIARYGAGVYGIPEGPTKITLTAPVTGLLLEVSAGHAMIGGPVEIASATTYAVPNNTARVWIWLRQTGAAITHTTTTTPPAGESCLLGSCVTAGGIITSLDTSGVVYLRGGKAVRSTADDGAPSDSPPATALVQTDTAFCSYDWTGAGHRQQYIPSVTADPANPGPEDVWHRTDTDTLMLAGGTASAPADPSGIVATDKLGSGTADATTFLRGDQTWAVPPSGSSGSPVITASAHTGAGYTLVLGDAGKIVELTNIGFAITLTVPANASVAFPVGTTIEVSQESAQVVTVAPDTGVTLLSRGGLLNTNGQYAILRLRKQATDTWQISGDRA